MRPSGSVNDNIGIRCDGQLSAERPASWRKAFVRRLATTAVVERSAYRGTIPRYQYILQFPDHDELRTAEHDGHMPGERIELDGWVWTVESIVRTPRWADVERVVLRLADPMPRRPGPEGSSRSAQL